MKEYRDHYFLKAKQENYPARSVYKLKEIDGRFKIFRKGMKVLDLGAAPGSWSLGAAERVGAQGKVLACDIQSTVTVFPPNVEFHQEDVFQRSEAFERQLAGNGALPCRHERHWPRRRPGRNSRIRPAPLSSVWKRLPSPKSIW